MIKYIHILRKGDFTMKRFIAVLSGLLVLPAFAEVAPVFYDEIVEYTDEMLNADDAEYSEVPTEQTASDAKKIVAPRTTANRSSSRTMSATNSTQSIQRAVPSTRAMASSVRNAQKVSRGTVSRTPKVANTANTQTRVSRAGASTATNVTPRNAQSSKPVSARVSVNSGTIASIKNSGNASYVTSINDSGEPLYNSTTARIGVGSRRASARISTPITAATTPVVTEEDVSATTSNLEKIAELTEYCKAQYASCMDNYCNVLDDNQGRCSCSKNLKNYEKTEQALTAATENFKDVVQKIKYIGLTADQVTALFAETEAELTMKSKNDSSQLKNSLDAIKKQIIDASSPAASSSTTGVTMDLSGLLNVDFTAGFDLNAFLGGGTATTNVSNQRGETLYKTATQRCKVAVLNSCTSQGIDANLITNSYDLEIDKQCIVYERSLNEANSEMKTNVANASVILQQARLLLMQNKNSYDLRGCVAAIDACMQDEYVCGSDYELCLDPTGKYLANGEVVKGGTPGISGGNVANAQSITEYNLNSWTSKGMYELYATWNYNTSDVSATPGSTDTLNAWGGGRSENLGNYINVAVNKWSSGSNYKSTAVSDDMATYILQKVGYIDSDDKTHGMCSSVMKQCQDYTYNQARVKNKNYKPDNEVIRQYLASALTKIKVQQDSILADYAEGCRSDVSSCLSTNGYDEQNTNTTASQTAVNACRSEIATCMSVGGQKPSDSSTLTLRQMRDWVNSMLRTCSANYYLVDSGEGAVTCEVCPRVAAGSVNVQLESPGGQETTCHCPDGYTDSNINPDTGMPRSCVSNN